MSCVDLGSAGLSGGRDLRPSQRAYLPELCCGKRVIVQVQDGFMIDNSELQTTTPGFDFRRSRNFDNRLEGQISGNRYAPWGSVLTGVLAAG